MIHSFDIFDTLLTRPVTDPTTTFLLLARQSEHRKLTGMDPAAFRELRIQAEKTARRHAPNGEVRLDAIYRTAEHLAVQLQGKAKVMAAAEIAFERKFLKKVPGIGETLAEIRKQGYGVRFLSDMYLPAEFLRDLLREHGLWQEGERILISCEEEHSKANDGGLFRRLLEIENVAAETVLHHGNHPNADVEQPRKLGIRVRPFFEGNPNRYERLLESFSCETNGVSGLMAGASRLARLQIAPDSDREKTIVRIAAGVAAPALAGYIWWVLENAQRENLQRLYFLSRDGELLCRIARRLAPKIGYRGELRYLYGGRKAWFGARTIEVDDFLLDYAFSSPDFLTPAMIARRLGIRWEDLAPAITEIGLPVSRRDHPLEPEERNRLREAIRSGKTADAILSAAKESRELTLDYLRQEGFLDAPASGLVDIGWMGKTVRSLTEILQMMDAPIPRFFFFGLFECRLPEWVPVPEAFLFDEHRGLGQYDASFSSVHYTRIMENFCAGSHGSVTGYRRAGDRIEPVLKSKDNPEPRAWGVPLIHRTIDAFLEHLDLSVLLPRDFPPLQAATERIIREFYEYPAREEALTWGDFPIETDANAEYRNPWARPLAWSDVYSMLRHGHLQLASTHWSAGSIALSSSSVHRALRISQGLRNRLNSIKQRLLP